MLSRRFFLLTLTVTCVLPPVVAVAETAVAIERRLARTVQTLSSDEFGGRGLGTPGIQQAAELIRRQFEELGLRTNLIDGQPYQPFKATTASKLGSKNQAALVVNDQRIELAIDENYTPLAIGGSAEFDLPLVFAGYGITAPEANYDDYANLDVTGKAVILLRHEPQQGNPHSAFDGTEHSRHAPFSKKVSNAFQHGASAVIFTTDDHEIRGRVKQWEERLKVARQDWQEANAEEQEKLAKKIARFEERLAEERDPLMTFKRAGESSDRDLPVLYVRPGRLNQLLAQAQKPMLAELEQQIDNGPKPQSFAFTNAKIVGKTDIEREQASVFNVLGVLDGAGPLADEVIVIGAHYDHIGRGGGASASPGSTEIHNGADDNASGVTALLETARRLTEHVKTTGKPFARTILFIAFTGEEEGLLGSAEYVREPLYPLEKTIAMLNYDMVGRLADNKLIVNGTGTAREFDALVDNTNKQHGFEITKSPGGFGPSDHSSFYGKQVPVLHFFTGTHPEYHRPEDDFELLNVPGIRRISAMVTDVAMSLADAPQRTSYVEVEQPKMNLGKSDPRPYFGSIPDFAGGGGGYAISGVAPGSPADDGGLRGGDKIVKFGDSLIGNLEDFDNALRKFVAGDKVKVTVRRGDKEEILEVTLDPPK